ncbi:MAG: NosD domain-containing protein, partial [Elusimicrobiota bacterium]
MRNPKPFNLNCTTAAACAAFLLAGAATDAAACEQPITLTASTTLTRDYQFCAGGFTLGTNDVSLDCAGHAIAGSGTSNGVTLLKFASGMQVKNCAISGFENGIWGSGYAGGIRNLEIVDNTIHASDRGIYLNDNIHYGAFARNTVYATYGIQVSAYSEASMHNSIVSNHIYFPYVGVALAYAVNNEIADNVFYNPYVTISAYHPESNTIGDNPTERLAADC